MIVSFPAVAKAFNVIECVWYVTVVPCAVPVALHAFSVFALSCWRSRSVWRWCGPLPVLVHLCSSHINYACTERRVPLYVDATVNAIVQFCLDSLLSVAHSISRRCFVSHVIGPFFSCSCSCVSLELMRWLEARSSSH